MGKIKISRQPEGRKFRLFNFANIELKPGITVLVGCNGYGKTTFIEECMWDLQSKKIPVILYDNLHDGGVDYGDCIYGDKERRELAFLKMNSSEGECIVLNLGKFVSGLKYFLRNGYKKPTGLSTLLNDKKLEQSSSNERYIFLDAIDSGLSIDAMEYIMKVLNIIINDEEFKDKDTYIILSTNSYEFVRNNRCLDVHTMNEIYFKDYEEYRKFILKTRSIKDRREKRYFEKQKEESSKQQ